MQRTQASPHQKQTKKFKLACTTHGIWIERVNPISLSLSPICNSIHCTEFDLMDYLPFEHAEMKTGIYSPSSTILQQKLDLLSSLPPLHFFKWYILKHSTNLWKIAERYHWESTYRVGGGVTFLEFRKAFDSEKKTKGSGSKSQVRFFRISFQIF